MEKLVWRQEGLRYFGSWPRRQGACSFRDCMCRMLWGGGKSRHGRPRDSVHHAKGVGPVLMVVGVFKEFEKSR